MQQTISPVILSGERCIRSKEIMTRWSGGLRS